MSYSSGIRLKEIKVTESPAALCIDFWVCKPAAVVLCDSRFSPEMFLESDVSSETVQKNKSYKEKVYDLPIDI